MRPWKTSAMLFSEESDLRLMQLVKENPVLYDNSQPNYTDSEARAVAWQKIGDEIKRPAKDCKTRWLHMRDVYRRILKQEKKRGRNKPYKYENSLAFIRPFFKTSKFKSKRFDEINYEDESDAEKPKKRKIKKRKKEFVCVQEFEKLSPFNFISTNCGTSDFDKTDTIDAFLRSIGATLKTFSPYHLNVAKSKIFSIVQQHDLQQIVQLEEADKTAPY